MRRYIGLIALAVVFVVLLVVVLVTQPKSSTVATGPQPTATQSADQAKLQIIQLPKDEQPTRLEINLITETKKLALKYEGAAWKIDGQESTPLDSLLVSNNVGQFLQLKGQQLVQEQQGALTEFGLDKPSASIALTSPSGTKTLLVGIVNPVSKLYYVKLDNDPKVWTLSPSLVDTFKAWVTTPPIAPPTPTPLPTLPPTPTPNLTATVTALTPGASTSPATTTTTGASPAATTASATTPAANTAVPAATPTP